MPGITLEICSLLPCVTAMVIALGTASGADQRRRSAMKKLMAIVALAVTLISVSPFAASAAVFEDAQHGAGIGSQS